MDEKDLLSIKNFAKFTGIKQSILRHYDEIGLFQPIQRGENGYRYYSPPQTITVNLINVMKGLGMNLSSIAEVVKDRSPKSVLKLLNQQQLQVSQELYRLQKALTIIHAYGGMIQEGLLVDEHNINIQQIKAVPLEFGPVNDFSTGCFYDSFYTFVKHMKNQKIDPLCTCGGFYDDFNTFYEKPGQPTHFFTYTVSGTDSNEEGSYLVGYIRGYYGQLGDLPERLNKYAQEHKLTFDGPVYEIYLHDEVSVMDPDQYLIQVSVQLKK